MNIEDHPLGALAQRLHALAEARGESSYVDPVSQNMVLTARYLFDRGFCCSAGCRHCPYPPEVQATAGRPADAPCWQNGNSGASST